MKLRLNLLPANKANKIKHNKILKFIILQEIMIIFITLLFFGLIEGIDLIAKVQLHSVQAEAIAGQSSKEQAEIKKYEGAFREVKNKLLIINKIQNKNINWITIFKKIAQASPEGVVFKSMSNDNYNILMNGVAMDRDKLVELKTNIEKDDCFSEADIPLNNIVLKNNIDFEINLKIEEKCLTLYE